MNEESKKILIRWARAALEEKFYGRTLDPSDAGSPADVPLDEAAQGVFITLYHKGALRGCIGTIKLEGSLKEAVAKMTLQSAFGDPRFPPLQAQDYPDVRVEISLLSPMVRVSSLEGIVPGRHGVYLRKGFQGGLLLPQVWKELPQRELFLNTLCTQKAGLPPGSWRDPEVETWVFTVQTILEPEKAGPAEGAPS